MSHIFISYSRNDLDFAQRIVEALATQGLDTWIDWKSIPPTVDWEDEIYRGIEEADAFLFMISPDSVRSKMCNKEISHAVKNGKRIIPIVLCDTDPYAVPNAVSKLNWIFCRGGRDDFSCAIEETRRAIRTDYEWLRYHTKLQVKALEWERIRDASRLLRGKELREAEEKLSQIGGPDNPQPTSLQRMYLLASRKLRERQQRRLISGVALGTVTVIVTLLISNIRISQERDYALARQLSAQSLVQLSVSGPGIFRSVLLSIEATGRSYSPDSIQTFSTALALMPRKVFETKIDKPVTSLLGESEFTADGRYIAVALSDGDVVVTEVETGREVCHITQKGMVGALSFSSDDRWLAFGGKDGTAFIWDINTCEELTHIYYGSFIDAISFIDKDSLLAIGGRDDIVRVWNIASAQESLHFLHYGVSDIAISPDNQWLITGGWDGLIDIWDIQTGSKMYQFAQGVMVFSIGISPDGKLLASGGGESLYGHGEAHVWDINSGREILQLPQSLEVGKVEFSPTDAWLAICSYDGTTRVWDLKTDKEFLRIPFDVHYASNIIFSQDSKKLITVNDEGVIQEWELDTTREKGIVTHLGALWDMKFSSRGNFLAMEGDRPEVDILDMNSYQIVKSYDLSGLGIEDLKYMDFSSNEAWVVINRDGTIEINGITSGTKIPAPALGTSQVNVVKFSPAEPWLVLGGNDGVAQIWDISTNQEINRLVQSNGITAVEFSSDGKFLVVGSQDGIVRIWRISSGQEVDRIASKGGLLNIALSPGGKWTATVNTNHTMRIWKRGSHDIVMQLDNVSGMIFSPDDLWLGVATNNSLEIWNLEKVRLVAKFPRENYHSIWDTPHMSFSPDSNYVAIGFGAPDSVFGEVRIWKLKEWQEINHLIYDTGVLSVRFHPAGKILAIGTADGKVYLSLWNPQDLIDEACLLLPRNMTLDEWQKYVGTEVSYHATCPNLAIPDDAQKYLDDRLQHNQRIFDGIKIGITLPIVFILILLILRRMKRYPK